MMENKYGKVVTYIKICPVCNSVLKYHKEKNFDSSSEDLEIFCLVCKKFLMNISKGEDTDYAAHFHIYPDESMVEFFLSLIDEELKDWIV